MSNYQKFKSECKEEIVDMGNDVNLRNKFFEWINLASKHKYSYHFEWLGRPVIQIPQDIVALQELIWEIKPDLIIETGIAHGGSLILSASMLALLDLCESVEQKQALNPATSKRKVLGIDIDIRGHNRLEIESHPMSSWIQMIEGSSVEDSVIEKVYAIAKPYKRILVVLDSNHTHDHVLDELNAYSPLVSIGSYCVVFDTVVEDLPEDLYPERPWGRGNNPKTAVHEFLATNNGFEIDKALQNRLMITVAPDGYLKRIS
jgi:cephalosporin hydroxylase